MRSALVYTFLRILLLVAVAGLLYATGLRGPLLLLAAFLLSGAVSLVVLRGPRSEFGDSVSGFFGRINARIDEATSAEDVEITPQNTNEAPKTADSHRSS